MSGEVVHFELPVDNAERARQFYGRVFGWKLEAVPGMSYTIVHTAASTDQGMPKEAGAINGGLADRKSPVTAPVITILVDEVDSALRNVAKHGGAIVERKAPIGDGSMGFTGYFKDPEGNVVGLYQRGTG